MAKPPHIYLIISGRVALVLHFPRFRGHEKKMMLVPFILTNYCFGNVPAQLLSNYLSSIHCIYFVS